MKRSARMLFMAFVAVFSLSLTHVSAEARPRKGRPAAVKVDRAKLAREAYYGGDVKRAFTLAAMAGERWIAGLSAFRLGRPTEAQTFFQAVAGDPKQDGWQRAAAAFWAARSATVAGSHDQAAEFLQLAAAAPHTFYGMIAERQLALAGAQTAEVDPIARLIRASSSGPVFTAPRGFDMPALEPVGGFTIDRAMVYALVKQESRFNPAAVSHAGAVGLMQLMPAAAARAAGDDKLLADNTPLFDPAFNLRVGQDYFTWLMDRGLQNRDLLRAVAAYNGGPGTLIRAAEKLGADCDSLLLIESLPAQETRNYVEKVMANYWTYRKMMGGENHTLDALARGEKLADASLDKWSFSAKSPWATAQSIDSILIGSQQ
ncbi:MAG: lytic transglycosylase domain-containing protein [Caulobacter sp.]